MTLQTEYSVRRERVLVPLAQRLQEHLQGLLAGMPRIDSIRARAKSVDRFIDKAQKQAEGTPKYTDPLSQIQDQVGARIITFYLSDVDAVAKRIDKYMRKIENQKLTPESASEFGYIGQHFVLFLPSELFDDTLRADDAPKFFELQVKTLFQHAWAEANHDLAYKPNGSLSTDQRRKIAFTAAQSWGADMMFQELAGELSTPHG